MKIRLGNLSRAKSSARCATQSTARWSSRSTRPAHLNHGASRIGSQRVGKKSTSNAFGRAERRSTTSTPQQPISTARSNWSCRPRSFASHRTRRDRFAFQFRQQRKSSRACRRHSTSSRPSSMESRGACRSCFASACRSRAQSRSETASKRQRRIPSVCGTGPNTTRASRVRACASPAPMPQRFRCASTRPINDSHRMPSQARRNRGWMIHSATACA